MCISGSNERIKKFAKFLQSNLGLAQDEELYDRCLTDRYVMYKVGPVLALSVSSSYFCCMHAQVNVPTFKSYASLLFF